MPLEFVIFDCDGVIIDSNELKHFAFKEAVSDYDDEYVNQFLEFNRLNGGVPRAQKFHHFYEHIVSVEESKIDELVKEKSKRFSLYCHKHLPSLPITDGLPKYLDHLYYNGIPCFIISGGNKEEINLLLDNHNLKHYFSGVYGGDQSKNTAIEIILGESDLQSRNGLFYGDSALDGETANQNGIPFIFVSAYSEVTQSELSHIKIHRVIENFSDLHT